MEKEKKSKYMHAIKDCNICHGLGLQYFADSFDRDNGTQCPSCKRKAEEKGMKLILPYQR